jgi:RHS repeat-associated protein
MWPIKSRRTRKPSTAKTKKRLQLAIEQLEPRWLFSAKPIGLFDNMDSDDERKLFDDLRQDINILVELDKLRNQAGGGGGGAAASARESEGGGGGAVAGGGTGREAASAESAIAAGNYNYAPGMYGDGGTQAAVAANANGRALPAPLTITSANPSLLTKTAIATRPLIPPPSGGVPGAAIIDANEALALVQGVTEHTFSTWSMDLRASASGAPITSYSWDTSLASDATSITGASTYRLQFSWASFTGAARTDKISLTLNGNGATKQTITFSVDGTDSPAYSSQVDTASQWPGVIQPDAIMPDQQMVGDCNCYHLGLATGELQTSHSLPGYNPNIPGLMLDYHSTDGDARPIFVVLYQLDPNTTPPPTVHAQLTLNSTAGQIYYYDITDDPLYTGAGALLQIALQGNATSLSTGRYLWTITVTTDATPPVTTTYTGSVDIVNNNTAFLGAGWSLAGFERIYSVTGGVILDTGGGTKLWFASSVPLGTFTRPPGDTSTLVQNMDNTYTRTLKDGTKYNFSSGGLETSLVNTNNEAVTFSYNGSNQLSTITDWNNQTTTLAYSGNYVQTITDPANRVTTLTHSSAQLTAIQDADSSLWSYGYDSSNRMTTKTTPLSQTTTITYGSAGRVTSVNRADGTTESLAAQQTQGFIAVGSGTSGSPVARTLAALATGNYTDANSHTWKNRTDWLGFGRATNWIDPLSDTTVTHRNSSGFDYLPADANFDRTRQFFDGNGNPTTIVGGDNNATTMTYNGFSEVLTTTDQLGHITTSTYDSHGNVTTVQDPLNHVTSYTYNSAGLMLTRQDPLGHTTSYGYDSQNRLTTMTDALNQVTSYGYDSAGRQITVTDPSGATTTRYDNLNRVTAVTDALGHTATTVYDSAGNVSARVDALSRRTSYSYDSRNRLIATEDPLTHYSTIVYDSAGNVSARVDALGRRTSYTYDNANRLIQVKDALGNLSTTVYDSYGNRVVSVDALNHRTSYSFDSLNRLIQTQDARGNFVTLTYDAAGRQISSQDGLGHITTSTYDAANRLIATTDALNHTTTYGFDAASNQVTVTDPFNRTTTTAFDALNRRQTVTDARNGVTSYGYDVVGRLLTITDAVNNTTTYLYDSASRQTGYTDALGTATYVYDNANERTDVYDRNGRHRAFAFDAAGRETTEKWLDAGGNTTRTITYSYDNANETTQITDPSSTLAYSFDNDGRVQTVDTNGTSGLARVLLTYAYDAAGNRTSVTDNLSGSYTYTYDNVNNLASASMTVSGNQGPQVTLAYDAANRMTGVTRKDTGSNNIVSVYSYDNADRLTTLMYNSSVAGALATYAYGFDNASQLTSYTGPEGHLTYTYDNARELTGVGNDRSESYSYDLNGNRNYGSYTKGPGNELTGDETYTYAYDSEGNLTSKTRLSDGETWALTWDYRNRLTQDVEKTSAGATVTNDVFTYDVLDRRIGKSVNGTQTWMAYDRGNTFADFNNSGTLTMRYLYGNALDSLYGRRDNNGNNAWYLTDMLGSVRQVTQTNGTILDAITYDSYGNILSETNPSNGDRFKFTGREWDSEIGLQYNRARYYDPKTGRWISRDPAKFRGGDKNLYRYVHNSPTSAHDPSGLIGASCEERFVECIITMEELAAELGWSDQYKTYAEIVRCVIPYDDCKKERPPPTPVTIPSFHYEQAHVTQSDTSDRSGWKVSFQNWVHNHWGLIIGGTVVVATVALVGVCVYTAGLGCFALGGLSNGWFSLVVPLVGVA